MNKYHKGLEKTDQIGKLVMSTFIQKCSFILTNDQSDLWFIYLDLKVFFL